MKQTARAFFILLLTAVTLLVVNIHQAHYLFVHHELQHDCATQHLHGEEETGHCPVCKFDLAHFTDEMPTPATGGPLHTTVKDIAHYTSPLVVVQLTCIALRGPPALV